MQLFCVGRLIGIIVGVAAPESPFIVLFCTRDRQPGIHSHRTRIMSGCIEAHRFSSMVTELRHSLQPNNREMHIYGILQSALSIPTKSSPFSWKHKHADMLTEYRPHLLSYYFWDGRRRRKNKTVVENTFVSLRPSSVDGGVASLL